MYTTSTKIESFQEYLHYSTIEPNENLEQNSRASPSSISVSSATVLCDSGSQCSSSSPVVVSLISTNSRNVIPSDFISDSRTFQLATSPQSVNGFLSPPVEHFEYIDRPSSLSSHLSLSTDASRLHIFTQERNITAITKPQSKIDHPCLFPFLPPTYLKKNVLVSSNKENIRKQQKKIKNYIYDLRSLKSRRSIDKTLPKNVSVINSNQLKSPRVKNVDKRFVFSNSRLITATEQNQMLKGKMTSRASRGIKASSSQLLSKLFNSEVLTGSSPNTSSSSNSINNNNYSQESKTDSNKTGQKTTLTKRNFTSLFLKSNKDVKYNQVTFNEGSKQELNLRPKNELSHLDKKRISKCFQKKLLCSLKKITMKEFEEKYQDTKLKSNSGSSGIVKTMLNTTDNRLYAVKKFKPIYKTETAKRYWNKVSAEFCIGTTLNHPNIIKTFEIILVDNENFYQIIEYCQFDMFNFISRVTMTPNEIFCCFKQMLKGVKYMHDIGLAHLDLKLDNCVITKEGIVKLIDFGTTIIYKYPFSNKIFEAVGVMGSDPYLAPEVILFERYDPRPVDIWSLGIIFFCMTVKKFPWKIPNLLDESFKLFCLGRNSTSLTELILEVPDTKNKMNYSGDSQCNFSDLSDSIQGGDGQVDYSYNSNSSIKNDRRTPQSVSKLLKNSPHIGPSRILHLLPDASKPIIGHMLMLAPAKRMTISDVFETQWVKEIEDCQDNEPNDISSHTHFHKELEDCV